MLNQNARRTGAAGVIARALATLGAATLLLTSTGWGALAGDTGSGAINLKAYQGAAAAVPGPAPKDGNDAAPTNHPERWRPDITQGMTSEEYWHYLLKHVRKHPGGDPGQATDDFYHTRLGRSPLREIQAAPTPYNIDQYADPLPARPAPPPTPSD